MKLLKSLTFLLTLTFLVGCTKNQSATFSSSETKESQSSSEPSSSNKIISYYDGYYDSLTTWQNGEDLKNQLHAIIRNGYQPLSYVKSDGANYLTNIHADHSKYDYEYLDVVYSSEDIYKKQTNTGWQREHAFCASLMCGSLTGDAVKFKGRATDFHNLFASSSGANSSRGNKNYGNAAKDPLLTTDRTTDSGEDGYSFDENNFEPGNKDKGRLARAIFYMATMYKDDENDTVNNITMKGLKVVEGKVDYVSGEDCRFAIGNLSTLLDWNNKYEVDLLEMQHNISVYQDKDNPDGYAQGNRNPYVDFPELVDYVYGDKKDSAGSLSALTPAFVFSEEKILTHYAIKEAKREYGFGEKLSQDDYIIVKVYNSFTDEAVNESDNVTNSLLGHEFSEADLDIAVATIITPKDELYYSIFLNPMVATSTGILALDKTGINDKKPNEEQLVTYGDYDFYFSFTTDYTSVTSNGMTLSNDNQKGGFYLGSGNRVLTGVTFKSKESYTIDQAFIKTYAGNKDSGFDLVIKVGDSILLDTTRVTYNQATYAVYGAKIDTPLTGQLSFIFTGSNKLYFNSIAFNSIIV